MEFPKVDFADEEACFQRLLELVHPDGLRCPRCRCNERLVVQRRHGPSWIVDYQCQRCGRVFNAWTQTVLAKTHHPPSQILRIMQERRQGKSIAQLAREHNCHRGQLGSLVHRWDRWMTAKFGPPPHETHQTQETSTRRRTGRPKPQKSAGKSNHKTATRRGDSNSSR